MASKKNYLERDAHDGGVPMLESSDPRAETAGPEDALGLGPKRGDYTNRVGDSTYHPHTVVAVEGVDENGEPTVEQVSVPQKPLAEEIGDEVGLKGGVDTHSDQALGESLGNAKSGDSKQS